MSSFRYLLSVLLIIAVVHLSTDAASIADHDHSDDELTVHPQKPPVKFAGVAQLEQLIQQFSSHYAPVSIHVRLVGFNSDGNKHIQASEYELFNYLATLPTKLNSSILSTRENLLVGAHVTYQISKASSMVTKDIQTAVDAAVRSAVLKRAEGPEYLVEIPYTTVDDVILKDLQYTKDNHYTIFILNLNSQTVKYAYKYSQGCCSGALWSSKRTYTWIDITAGPLRYGPGPGHKGQVLDHSVPHLSFYNDAVVKKALMPDLSALITSAVNHLIWPPLQHAQVEHRGVVEVHIIHMHDSLLPGRPKVQVEVLLQELKALQLDGTQAFNIQNYFIGFSKCDICVAGYAKAVKMRTTRAKGAAVQMDEHAFIDAMELYAWMAANKDEVYGDVGIHEFPNHHGPLILPVFLFDVSSPEPMLLDGQAQAMAFPGMVLALHTRAEILVPEFRCHAGDRWSSSHEITRSVLASVVQAGWGVADTSLTAGPLLIEQQNFLWTVGNDPFTPASNTSSLSYAQISSAQRNMVLVKMNQTLTTALTYLRAIVKLADGRPLTDLFTKKQIQKLDQEFGFFQSRSQQAVYMLGQRKYHSAYKQMESAELDLHEIKDVVMEVHYDLGQHFVCRHTTHFYRWMIGAVGIFAVAVALFAVRSVKDAKARDRWL